MEPLSVRDVAMRAFAIGLGGETPSRASVARATEYAADIIEQHVRKVLDAAQAASLPAPPDVHVLVFHWTDYEGNTDPVVGLFSSAAAAEARRESCIDPGALVQRLRIDGALWRVR